ncbi:MAG TPA: aminotransferase class I/II-fold pyridoxal phosphate-dependent enzyme, partial [Nitrospirota bacterium]
GAVAFMQPSFAMYRIIARSQGQDVLPLPLNHAFDIDFDGSLKLIMERRPNILFIAYPNNPTGNLFTRDKVKRLIAGFAGIVVVDEAYHSFAGESFINELDESPNLVVLRTLSKVGLAGLRVGVMVAGKDVVDAVNKVRLPYNVNALSQAAVVTVLRRREVIDEQVRMIVEERERLSASLSAISGVTVFPSRTNFIMFKLRGASEVFGLLKDDGILIKDLDSPGPLKDCLRVTVGTPEENGEFLKKFKELVS